MNDKDRPPFDASIFSYEHLKDPFPIYPKSSVVKVIQIGFEHGFFVDTPSGRQDGKKGDYLVLHQDKSRSVLTKQEFKQDWVVIDKEKGKHDKT